MATPPLEADANQQRASLQRQVLGSLRNPGSARFKNLFLGRDSVSQAFVLCGWVDAEDESGQRRGYVAFIAAENAAVLYQVSDPYGSFPHLWRARCPLDGPT